MATWTVVRQVPSTGRGTDGNVQRGVDVTYQLDDGTTNTVFVPYGEYNAAHVRDLLAAHAANTAEIGSLTGQV